MTPDDTPNRPFLSTPKGRRLFAAAFFAATVAVVTGVVVGGLFAFRKALPEGGPGPKDLDPYSAVNRLAVSDNCERAAAIGYTQGPLGPEGSIRVWDLPSGRPTRAREYDLPHWAHPYFFTWVSLSPDGRVLAAVTTVDSPLCQWLTCWQVETGRVLCNARLREQPPGMPVFTADGTNVILALQNREGIATVRVADGTVNVVRPTDYPSTKAVYVPSIGRVVEVRMPKDGSGRKVPELASWDPTAEGPPTIVPLAGCGDRRNIIYGFGVPRDGRTVLVLHVASEPDQDPDMGQVTTCDVATGRQLARLPVEYHWWDFAVSGDGKVFATGEKSRGGRAYSIDAFRTSDGGLIGQSIGESPPGGGKFADYLTLVPDSSALYYVRRRSSIVRLDLRTGEETVD
jgi:hypothetical protein